MRFSSLRSKNSIFSLRKEELEHVIVRLLTERHETIATAESCTGGLLAHRLTNVPGASKVFLGRLCCLCERNESQQRLVLIQS